MRPHAACNPCVPRLSARFTEPLLCAGIDDAEVLHRQRNPVTQTFEYYVHYVECAQPACTALVNLECPHATRKAARLLTLVRILSRGVTTTARWWSRREQSTAGWTSG